MAPIKSKRIPVAIDKAVYEKLKAYSDMTGVAVARAVERALGEWLETVGAVHMEVLAGKFSGKALLGRAALAPVPVEPRKYRPLEDSPGGAGDPPV